MFNLKRSSEPDSLDHLIDEVQIVMRSLDPETEEFKLALGRLKELRKLKSEDTPRPKLPSPDTIAIVLANLAGILIITQHEHVNVITSKATGFVQKLR